MSWRSPKYLPSTTEIFLFTDSNRKSDLQSFPQEHNCTIFTYPSRLTPSSLRITLSPIPFEVFKLNSDILTPLPFFDKVVFRKHRGCMPRRAFTISLFSHCSD